jgi:hypothetical protein
MRTDVKTEVTKLIVAFRNFAKAPNKYIFEDDKVNPFRVKENQFYPKHPPVYECVSE